MCEDIKIILSAVLWIEVLTVVKKKAAKYIADFDYQDFFSSILWAILIAILFRTFLFEPFRIPTGSMIPTLREGDYLFAAKYPYGYSRYSFPFGFAPFSGRFLASAPQRGDIIIFKGVHDPQTFYIKRLIGLPGDVIQLKRGVLYINDEMVKREYIGEFFRKGVHGENIRFNEFEEQLTEDLSYSVLDANIEGRTRFPDNTEKYIVPKGHYFFVGDNRNQSADSRYLSQMGYVPEDRIIAKALFLFWTSDFSFYDFFTTMDSGRALKVIH